jgi:hypothetical protein
MVLYTCNECNYTTTRKDNYNKHCLTKKHIDNEKISHITNESINEFKCVNCDKIYKHQSSLCKHNKKCIIKNIDSINNKDELKEMVKILNKKIDKLNKNKNNTINIQNNIQQNNHNNIQLLAYSESDLSHLKDSDIKQCINLVYGGIPKLIEKIHFNPLKPENMNIYINSIKDKYVEVYDGKKWNKKLWRDENEVLIEDKKNILDEWIEENGDEVLIQKYKKLKESIQIDEYRDALKDRTRLLLYNKKNDIPKSLKMIEE